MNMNSERTKTMAVLLAVVVMVTVWSLSFADDSAGYALDNKTDESVRAIEQRLETLEKLVGPSRKPVSERIEVLEKGLRDLTRAMGGTGWSSVESNIREAQKAMADLTEQRRQNKADLDKLKQLIKQVSGMKSEMASLRRTVKDMERRLRKLESRS